jgi:hypothetical protein
MANRGFPRADHRIPSKLEETRILEQEEADGILELQEIERVQSDWYDEEESLLSPFAVRSNPTPEECRTMAWFLEPAPIRRFTV